MKSSVTVKIIDPKARSMAHPGSTWHPGDFEFFDSKKAMAKVVSNLNATDHKFNVTVLVGPIEKGRKLVEELPVVADAINIVYCNNVTTTKNWIPMTSWILLHRIAHSMVTGGPMFNEQYTVFDGPEFNLFCDLDDLWATAYGEGYRKPQAQSFITAGGFTGSRLTGRFLSMRDRFAESSHGFSSLDVQSNCPAGGFLATKLFTMKSARENAISNELDIFAEAFAQFLHTGRFRLKPWSKSGIQEIGNTRNLPHSERGQTDWGHYLNQDTTLPAEKIQQLDEMVARIEQDANARMAELARRMVGHSFAF